MTHEREQQLRALATWHRRRSRAFELKSKQATHHALLHSRFAQMLTEAINDEPEGADHETPSRTVDKLVAEITGRGDE